MILDKKQLCYWFMYYGMLYFHYFRALLTKTIVFCETAHLIKMAATLYVSHLLCLLIALFSLVLDLILFSTVMCCTCS